MTAFARVLFPAKPYKENARYTRCNCIIFILYIFLFLKGCSSATITSPISHFHFQQYDFLPYLAYKRGKFVGRAWFFLELENIFETDRGAAGVLITGEPGSGKSALMSQLICSPYSSLLIHTNIIGYHLCEYSEKRKRKGARFVRNLVDQIAARFPGYSEYIIKNKQIRRELDNFCQQDVTGCFFTSILGPLRDMKPPDGLRYIVIDALDECFESDKTSEIIEILNSKILDLPKWLKVILTSRNLSMVTKQIPRSVRRTPILANDQRNVKDIRLYVSRFFSRNFFITDRLMVAMNFTSRTYGMKKLLDQIVTRAEGNFLFVKMTLQYMNDTDGIVDFRSLPTSLFDLYNVFFTRQFGNDGFGSFKSLFEILLYVASPLNLSDVEKILRYEYQAEDISQLIDHASCFLRFGHDGTVSIYHQSFAEWLIHQSAVIHINETRAHENIAKFQLNRIRERNMNVRPAEVIELFMHILAGNALEMYRNAINLLNITKIRDHRTNQTVLHYLATKPRSFQSALEFFIQMFDNVDIRDANKKTPAFYAASEGYVENLQSFIDKGADLSSSLDGFGKYTSFTNVVCNIGFEEFGLMHAASAKGHKDVVKLLLERNASLHESTNYPTSFHLASANGHLEILKLLYDYGMEFDVIALHHAAARNHPDVVEFLLKNVGIRDTCLQCTCKTEHHLAFSVEDAHLYFCETALHAAVSRRNIDIVKLLLAFGKESLECKHHSGKTVLMDAIERNDIEMVDVLLGNGADVTTQCGDTISKRSKSKLCSFSARYRQDFLYTVYCKKYSCKCGNTAIHVSAKYGMWKLAERLSKKNVFDLTGVKNCDGDSALAVAISYGHTHFIHHINETYRSHGHILNSPAIVEQAISRCSHRSVKHILDYPINYIYEHRWEFLLRMLNWDPYMQYQSGTISHDICLGDYEVKDISLGEWIQRASRKRFAIVKLLVESYKDKSTIIDKNDYTGKTLLHHAVLHGFDDAALYIHKIGADKLAQDRRGNSPFTLAMNHVGDTSSTRDASYRCYGTSDGKFVSCNTTSYDEIARYMVWSDRSYFQKCDARSVALLDLFITKQMPLSLYELLKAGVDVNCKDVERPFLKNLRLGGRQLTKVFQMFGVNISLQCAVTFTSSELHLISYLALPDDVGNLFKSVSKNRSPLQKLTDNNPDGVSILDKCYDAEGYLPIHRAAQGGNLDAIKWFKSVGVNTQLKTKSGLSALDLSILYLGDISQAELIAPIESTLRSIEKSNFQVPVTISNYRKEVFEELLRTFISATPEYRSEFPCGANLEGLSPLHMAAVKGTSVLRHVHKTASAMFPKLSLNCANKHRLDPVYVTNFYESVLHGGLAHKYSDNWDINFEIETQTSKKENPGTNKKIKNGPQSNRFPASGKDIDHDMQPAHLPDREMEYYIVFNYAYHLPSCKYTDELLHRDIPENIRINDCPGYDNKTNIPKEEVPYVDFTECSRILVRHEHFEPLCEREILQEHFRKYPCPTMMKRLKDWFTSYLRENRKISKFIAGRLGWKDVAEVKDITDRWPLSFFHNMVLKKHESWEYLTILNEALEVADVRFHSRIHELIFIKELTPEYYF